MKRRSKMYVFNLPCEVADEVLSGIRRANYL